MSVICVMILLMAVARTEASPVLGNGHVEYSIKSMEFATNSFSVCHYQIQGPNQRPCVLPANEGSSVTCSIDGEENSECSQPRKKTVVFKRLGKDWMEIRALDIPNKDVIVPATGDAWIDWRSAGAKAFLYGETKQQCDLLTVLMEQM
eukprot:Nk52_evm6s586 gene=Nk52_evmTU6s586